MSAEVKRLLGHNPSEPCALCGRGILTSYTNFVLAKSGAEHGGDDEFLCQDCFITDVVLPLEFHMPDGAVRQVAGYERIQRR